MLLWLSSQALLSQRCSAGVNRRQKRLLTNPPAVSAPSAQPPPPSSPPPAVTPRPRCSRSCAAGAGVHQSSCWREMAACGRGRRTQHHPCHFARRPSRRLQRAHRRGDVALDSIACDRRCQTTAWNRRGHFAVLVTRQRVNWIFCRSKTEAARRRRGRNADDFARRSDPARWHVGSGQHDRVFAVLRRAQTHFCEGRSGHALRRSRRRRCSRASTVSGRHRTDPVSRDISKRPEQFVLRHVSGFSRQKTHWDV